MDVEYITRLTIIGLLVVVIVICARMGHRVPISPSDTKKVKPPSATYALARSRVELCSEGDSLTGCLEGGVLDPESWYDSVLSTLSPELRGEFQDSPSFSDSTSTVAAVAATYREAVLRGTASIDEYRELESRLRGRLN